VSIGTPSGKSPARILQTPRPVLRYYQLSTWALTPIFQSDYEFITPFRYYGFRTSQRIAFVRKMMTKSMAGMMRGL
jgi:hypothetical protein